jgi:hypothetical protein
MNGNITNKKATRKRMGDPCANVKLSEVHRARYAEQLVNKTVQFLLTSRCPPYTHFPWFALPAGVLENIFAVRLDSSLEKTQPEQSGESNHA